MTETTVDIERCPQCQKRFMADPMLQAEALHDAVKHGESSARDLVREALASEHAEHGAGATP